MDEGHVAPRVAIKVHLDGDPKPRPGEVLEWAVLRRGYGVDELGVIILLPDTSVADPPFPGFQRHCWRLREVDGCEVCEPHSIEIVVLPDED